MRFLKYWLKDIFTQIGECAYCLGQTHKYSSLCERCIEEQLPWIKIACQRCALPITQPGVCGQCLSSPPYFHSARALFEYEWPVDRFIHRLKFKKKFDFLDFMANQMAEHFYTGESIDCLLPVPLHRNRLKVRGYNQSMELAKIISKKIQVPINWKLVQKTRDTQSQASIGLKRRKTNLHNAFTVQDLALAVPKHVVLVDDVLTTGATVNALSKALKRKGVEKIDVWCCCRTPKR